MSEVRILSPRPSGRPTARRPPGRLRAGFQTTEFHQLMALARILRPAKTAMSSGTAKTKHWVLEFETATKRQAEPLMGWIAAADTLNQIRLNFDTLEEAVAYADKHG